MKSRGDTPKSTPDDLVVSRIHNNEDLGSIEGLAGFHRKICQISKVVPAAGLEPARGD